MPHTRAASIEPVTGSEMNARLTATVRSELYEGRPLRILDAGCGRMWTWDLEEMRFELTGVDRDADALRLRAQERGDIDHWIVGDLRTVELPPDSYDLVHCAYVLEHIHGAVDVLERMYEALRPGGLMILKTPDRDSVYSFAARTTPHWLHVQYKRRIRGRKLAGTPGHGPYRVVYDQILSLPTLLDWAAAHQMDVITIVGENEHLDFFGKAAPAVDHALRIVAAMSRKRLTATHTNVGLAMRKRWQ